MVWRRAGLQQLRPDQKTLALSLVEEGRSISDVARTFNVHPATIHRCLNIAKLAMWYCTVPYRSDARAHFLPKTPTSLENKVVRLIGTVLREVDGEWRTRRRPMQTGMMAEVMTPPTDTVPTQTHTRFPLRRRTRPAVVCEFASCSRDRGTLA